MVEIPSSLSRCLIEEFIRWRDPVARVFDALGATGVNTVVVEACWSYDAKGWFRKKKRVAEALVGDAACAKIIHGCLRDTDPATLHNGLKEIHVFGVNRDNAKSVGSSLHGAVQKDGSGQLLGRIMKGLNAPLNEEPELKSGAVRVLTRSYPLRDYQKEIVESVLLELEDLSGKVITINLPTGGGKTRVALECLFQAFAAGRAKRIIWMADEKPLCEQAYDAAVASFGSDANPRPGALSLVKYFDSSGITPDDVVEATSPALIIATPDQLKSATQEFRGHIDLVVLDEAHTSIQERVTLVKDVSPHAVLALSATPQSLGIPGLTKKTTVVPERTFDLDTYRTEEVLIDRGVLVRLDEEAYDVFDAVPEGVDEDEFCEGFAPKDKHHPLRLLAVLKRVQARLQGAGAHHCLVFVESREEAAIVAASLNQLLGEQVASHVDCQTTRARRSSLFAQFSNVDHPLRVLCAVELLREGFDAPVADTVVLARRNNPEKNSVRWIQMVGRAKRGPESGAPSTKRSCLLITMKADGLG